LAKQFGVSEEALAGLWDPETHPFPPDQKAALRFADTMSRSAGQVPDELFEELRRHYTEPQIVEIATVVGLFNYFNRFNNALHMEITLTDPEVIVRRVEEAARRQTGVQDLCDRVVAILEQGRRYFWVGIYERHGDRAVRRAYRGPVPPCHSFRLGEGNVGTAARTGLTRVVDDVAADPTYRMCFAATRSELVVPIRRGQEIVGVIDVESDREAAFGEEDRDFAERVAAILAPFLAAPASRTGEPDLTA
jgi:GAF domain-containing protein